MHWSVTDGQTYTVSIVRNRDCTYINIKQKPEHFEILDSTIFHVHEHYLLSPDGGYFYKPVHSFEALDRNLLIIRNGTDHIIWNTVTHKIDTILYGGVTMVHRGFIAHSAVSSDMLEYHSIPGIQV